MSKPVTTPAPEVAVSAPHVFQAIVAVMADLAREGIAKQSRNSQQGYNFRGIDAVYNALAPILARHGLLILPRVVAHEQVERKTAKGGALFYTTVEVEFDLISGRDGSSHTIRTVGEAMDSADKSSNKAMSAAYKYAAVQAFCIPTEGDNDADATTHEVAPREVGNAGLDFAVATMRTCRTKAEFSDFWTKNKDGLRKQLNDAEWATLLRAKEEEVQRLLAEDQPPVADDNPFAKAA